MMTNDEKAAFLSARLGKLTASRMRSAMSFKKDGTSTAERAQLLRELLAERLVGSNVPHYVTPAMQFGLDMEDDAKAAYEAHTGDLLSPAGVFDHPRIDMFAATPDSLIPGGVVEFKVPTSPTYIEWCMKGEVPDEHKPQLLAQLACTGRSFAIFCAYDPRIRDASRRLFIRRFEPAANEIAVVEEAAVQFLNELENMFRIFVEAAA